MKREGGRIQRATKNLAWDQKNPQNPHTPKKTDEQNENALYRSSSLPFPIVDVINPVTVKLQLPHHCHNCKRLLNETVANRGLPVLLFHSFLAKLGFMKCLLHCLPRKTTEAAKVKKAEQ